MDLHNIDTILVITASNHVIASEIVDAINFVLHKIH